MSNYKKYNLSLLFIFYFSINANMVCANSSPSHDLKGEMVNTQSPSTHALVKDPLTSHHDLKGEMANTQSTSAHALAKNSLASHHDLKGEKVNLKLSPTYAGVKKNKSLLEPKNFYIELGAGYLHNLAAGDKSTVLIYPVPGAAPTPYNYYNNSDLHTFFPYAGAGYIWSLASRWSLALGIETSYYAWTQKGYFIHGGDNKYRYDINALLISSVERIIYQLSSKNKLFVGLKLGVSRLTSKDFSLTDSLLSVSHNDKTVDRFAYGINLGYLRELGKRFSLVATVGYLNLGKAALGTRQVNNAHSSGDIEQSLAGITTTLGVMYEF